MEDVVIRDLESGDLDWAAAVLDAELAGRWQARRGELVDALALPGLVAQRAGRRDGLLTYRVLGDACEIESLVALTRRAGVGSALVEEVRRRVGGLAIRVVTTNDNLAALRFYQRRGFRLTELRAGAVDESRRTLKPTIGEVGADGIPIRDEIELVLERDATAGQTTPSARSRATSSRG